jgi:purine-binding chemotaxis protein CheW
MIDTRHGIFAVGPHHVAVHASEVQEMFVLPEVRRPPGSPPWQRGLVSMRGTVLPALDLRLRLGLPTAHQELVALEKMLGEREQDHKNWLAELERSLAENRPFGLATDPRRCKFGQWYYAFQTEDPVLRSELARFEEPHARIHALAIEVDRLRQDGRLAEARTLVAEARDGLLVQLVALFESTRATLRGEHKEIGVWTRVGNRRAVLIVDRADAVTELEPFDEGADPVRDGVLRSGLVRSLGRWKGSTQPVLVLDLARLSSLVG